MSKNEQRSTFQEMLEKQEQQLDETQSRLAAKRLTGNLNLEPCADLEEVNQKTILPYTFKAVHTVKREMLVELLLKPGRMNIWSVWTALRKECDETHAGLIFPTGGAGRWIMTSNLTFPHSGIFILRSDLSNSFAALPFSDFISALQEE